MAKFLTGNELNAALENIFENAEELLILISPFIKLHDRYMSTLLAKKNNPKLRLIIVFGRNEGDLSKSMQEQDFNFFKDFPNIEILFEKRLHAKYYCNETSAILTSMNLYNYSQDKNIEAGVFCKKTILGSLANKFISKDNLDNTSYNYFKRVIEQSELLFKKIPEYESKLFSMIKKYKSSIIEVDKLTDFFSNRINYENSNSNNYRRPIGFSHTLNSNPKITVENYNLNEVKYLSVTALSKEFGLSNQQLNLKFEKLGWIDKKNDKTILTELGIKMGALIRNSQHGEYIAWPEHIIKEILQ